MAAATGISPGRVIDAFRETLYSQGISLGRGVAIPHSDLPELKDTLVCLVISQRPLALPSIDGQPPDIFFFILARRGDPQRHLLLLAHLARLTQSKLLRDGLRHARSAEELVTLVQAAEVRHAPVAAAGPTGAGTPGIAAPALATPALAASHMLMVISIGGEDLVDRLLVDLLDDGFDHACILEAQSLREAATSEVPLFAGFRDLFGDPGGRRVILLEVLAERVDGIIQALQRVCDDYSNADVRLSVVPVHTRWITARQAPKETAGGH